MHNSKLCSALAIAAFLCTYSPKSRADCVTNAQDVTPGDLDDQVHTRFMNMSQENRQNFVDNFCQEYLNYGCHFFKGVGWSNWEDSATLWAKWANAAWLVNFGYISDDMPTTVDCSPDGGFCFNYNDRPWHGRTDYRRLGKIRETPAHDEFHAYYAWGNNGGYLSMFSETYQVIYTDEWEELYCRLFDPTQYQDTAEPVIRAGMLVHEGQHSWQYRFLNKIIKHEKCGANSHDCDYFIYHQRHAIPNGALKDSYHTPYQVEWEFLCDIAEHPNLPLPLSVVIRADELAGRTGTQQVKNGPAPNCGSPLPGGKAPQAPKEQCIWTGCNSVSDCRYYNMYTDPICTAGCCKENFIPPPPA